MNGGAAFPVIAENGLGHVSEGMSLRDWFAGQALPGVLAAPLQSPHWYVINGAGGDPSEAIAAMVYGIADAMLEARKAKKP